MKRVIGSISATVVSLVLLLGFKTHVPEVAPTTTATDDLSDTTPPTTTADSIGTTTTTKLLSSSTKTITGKSVDTRWGPVQVKITVNGSTITSIDVIDYPQNNNRDIAINSTAVPALVNQALKAQSANINGVSGATYTTDGFAQSLQSALNQISTL